MALTTFASTATRTTGLAVDVRSRDFTIRIDEPADLGGTDTGPNPVELLLSSLGACQVIALTSFAPKFGVNIHDIRAEIEGDIDLDGFFGTADVRPGFQQIRIVIHVDTDSPADDVNTLVSFVGAHCPVEDTLAVGTTIGAPTVLVNE